MKKHRVTNLKLREISSVDRPAQVGAVSVLMKRAEPAQAQLIKVTFTEALKGNLLNDKVRDAFYNAFDGMYEGKEAFRKALIDELAAGGDGTTASDAYKAWLGTLVDQALGAAKALNAGEIAAVDLEKAFTKAATDWLADQETDMTIKTKAELTAAIEKAQAAGDKLTVGEVTIIHKAATDLNADDLLPATGVLAKGTASGEVLDPKTKKKVAQMVKRDELSADLRKHFDTLTTDAERDAFLEKSAEEQTEELAKRGGDDPVVYRTLDGVDIRKSHGDVTLALAKGRDEDKRELAKSRAATEDVELTKRAGDVLGNVGGDLVGKKALLKALDSISDTATRDAATAVLKSANEAGKGAFVRKGSGAGSSGSAPSNTDMSEAEAELDKMAKELAKAQNKDYHTAYSDVIQTVEGAALYKRFVEGE